MQVKGLLAYRLDVGSDANYTDSSGNVWSPDTGLFTPATAIIENGGTTPPAIANTLDSTLYQTYRANLDRYCDRHKKEALPTLRAQRSDADTVSSIIPSFASAPSEFLAPSAHLFPEPKLSLPA